MSLVRRWHIGPAWEDIEQHSKHHRVAVRAIIYHDGKLLLVHSSVIGGYKFPGGGVEPGESLIEALAREVSEECGRSAKTVGEQWARVTQISPARDDDPFDFFCMDSLYYPCIVLGDAFPLQRDSYEQELGMLPRWVSIAAALEANRSILDSEGSHQPWLEREIGVLQLLQAEYAKSAEKV